MNVSTRFKVFFGIAVLLSLASGAYLYSEKDVPLSNKINGVNLESPPKPVTTAQVREVAEIGSDWVAVIPYGFTGGEAEGVVFDHPHQWWGEGLKGAAELIQMAHDASLRVMLKPQVWVQGSWVGDYEAKGEDGWLGWERDYRAYIMAFANLADSLGADALCIGTEYRMAVKQRPGFWHSLILEIRKVYDGKLTYSANWDDYAEVPFWEDLDYIGISAYFPITDRETLTAEALDEGWAAHTAAMQDFHQKHRKPILFTEYGYRSAKGGANRPWESRGGDLNLDVQTLAYEALYRNVWNEPWFAGGFLWKWQFKPGAGGVQNSDFTPQGKPAMDIIKAQYSK